MSHPFIPIRLSGLMAVLAVASSSMAANYTITDLGAIADPVNPEWSIGLAINDSGAIAGSNGTPLSTSFRWTEANGIQLISGVPGAHNFTFSYDMNEQGQLLGEFGTYDDSDTYRAFIWNPDGNVTTLPLRGGWAINNHGQIAATGKNNIGYNVAVVWDPVAGVTEIDGSSIGVVASEGLLINDSGYVAGTAYATGQAPAPFFWDKQGGMVKLPDPRGATGSNVSDMNELGAVIGNSQVQSSDEHIGFVWTKEQGMVNIGRLPGAQHAFPYAINDRNQVIGSSDFFGNGAFIWDETNGIRDLNELASASSLGWQLFDPIDINNLGQITGWGVNPDGKSHAFLLTPVQLVAGDTDGDGDIDLDDLNNVRNNFGGVGLGDTDSDNDVDLDDLNAVRNNFGSSASQAVPEPSSLVLLTLTAIVPLSRLAIRRIRWKQAACLAPRVLGSAILALALTVHSQAATIVLPNSLEEVEGGGANAAFFSDRLSQRFQQVYAGAELASLDTPVWISQIAFRPDATNRVPFSVIVPEIQVNLSTTPKGPDNLSAVFAENVGADELIVRPRGPLTLVTANSGPALGPREFDITIDFATPFRFDPSAGNLLLDVRRWTPGQYPPGTFNFVDSVSVIGDAVSFVTTPGSLTEEGVDLPAGNIPPNSNGLVTRFTLTPVPEPSTLGLIGFGVAGLLFSRFRVRWSRKEVTL